MNDKILILGVSSWLGYLLADIFASKEYSVIGTVFNTQVSFSHSAKIIKIGNSEMERYEELISATKPTVIVNLLRGEDQDGLQLHKALISLSEKLDVHYVYASSVLALDAYVGVDLVESLNPSSVSEYGQFKGQCELELNESSASNLILRFASVQGWVSHKMTRNEMLLSKLKSKDTPIVVDTGIFQNRLLASQLVTALMQLIQDRVQGVIHLGTTDASEEVDFLRRQAVLFGYLPELVIEGNPRNINLVAVPDRIYSLYGDRFKFTEKQTLDGLLQYKGLTKYRN